MVLINMPRSINEMSEMLNGSNVPETLSNETLKDLSVIIAFDEPPFPINNGSKRVYQLHLQHAQTLYRSFTVFFLYKTISEKSDCERIMKQMGIDFISAPASAGNRTIFGIFGHLFRELDRIVSGNIFPTNSLYSLNKNHSNANAKLSNYSFDAIYIHKIQTAISAPYLLTLVTPLRIIDLHDDFIDKELQYRAIQSNFIKNDGLMRSLKIFPRGTIRQLFSWINVSRSRKTESRSLNQFDLVACANVEELARYAKLYPKKCLKLAFWPASLLDQTNDADNRCEKIETSQSLACGFIGSGDIMNVDAAIYLHDEIAPAILTILPNTKFVLAGAVSSIIRKIRPSQDAFLYMDEVDDINDYYNKINLSIVPLRSGAGVSVKTAEALARGIPTLATSIGARGIPDHPLLMIGQTPQAIAQLIKDFCNQNKIDGSK